MGRPERPVDPDAGPLQRFAYDLRTLRRRAGQPSYRELAKRAHYSDTTLSVAAGGTAMPSLGATLAFVRACGGDTEEWERRWHALAAECRTPTPVASAAAGETPAPDAPAPGALVPGVPAADTSVVGAPVAGARSAAGGAAGRRSRLTGRRARRWWAVAALFLAGAAIGLTRLTGPAPRTAAPQTTGAGSQQRDPLSRAATLTAGPGCSRQTGASFAERGAWHRADSERGACGGEFLDVMLTSRSPSGVAEWSFDTGGAPKCSLSVYLPGSSRASGIATYNVYGAGERPIAQFTVDQSFDQGLAFTEGPYRTAQGRLRVRLENNANGTLLRPIAAAAIQVSCS